MAETPHICPQSAFETCPRMHTSCIRLKSCTPANALLSGTWWWQVCWSCRAEPAVHEEEKRTWTLLNLTHTFTTHSGIGLCRVFFFFVVTLGHCVHTRTYTLTNRKWCQSLSPGRQRRLLRYRDSGFLFLSFSSAPLSHGLTQIDTSPSVAGVHPSHPLITGRPSEPGLASLYLPLSLPLSPSPSICLYLTIRAISACLSS